MIGTKSQTQIYLDGVHGRKPRVPVQQRELESRAMYFMSPEAGAYVAGGAGREDTVRYNTDAFSAWRIVPRVLRDVEQRNTSVSLLGMMLPTPIMLAPIGVLELVHRHADVAVARGASAHGVPMIFSNQASVDMETCARAMGDSPRLFQLYWSRSEPVVRSFVKRAEACGCRAIVLTLDTSMLGWRPRDLDLAHLPFMRGMGIAQYVSDPVFREELRAHAAASPAAHEKTARSLHALGVMRDLFRRTPGPFIHKLRTGWPRDAVRRFVATYSRPSLAWHDLARLRDMTSLPIILKGVLHADDARQALAHGVDGIVVSNHGGRQVDGAIATMDALPAIVDVVQRRIPVLLDSGIRSGADVFKAVALGASAVLLGRPYVYGLALAGDAGVHEVLRNVQAEFDLTMGLAGCRSVSEITSASLVRDPTLHLPRFTPTS